MPFEVLAGTGSLPDCYHVREQPIETLPAVGAMGTAHAVRENGWVVGYRVLSFTPLARELQRSNSRTSTVQ